jgi:hypothetical protein
VDSRVRRLRLAGSQTNKNYNKAVMTRTAVSGTPRDGTCPTDPRLKSTRNIDLFKTDDKYNFKLTDTESAGATSPYEQK